MIQIWFVYIPFERLGQAFGSILYTIFLCLHWSQFFLLAFPKKYIVFSSGDPRYPAMRRLHKISWVLSNTTSTVHLFITAAYWVTVYPLRSGEWVSLLHHSGVCLVLCLSR